MVFVARAILFCVISTAGLWLLFHYPPSPPQCFSLGSLTLGGVCDR